MPTTAFLPPLPLASTMVASLRVIFGVHASLDMLSLLSVLFPKSPSALLHRIANLNVAFFIDDAHRDHALLRRVFAYWTGSMSLARLVAIAAPSFDTFSVVCLMYLMEALAFEYEGFTAQTVIAHRARMVSLVSGLIAIATLLSANWLWLSSVPV
jgi:hypothetical protein